MKSGFFAVAGRPNVGKSSLVNALARRPVAIVADKPQTTRRRVRGIVNGDGYQLVLSDLPGFQRPRDRLTERMQRTVDQELQDVDGYLFVVDAEAGVGGGDRFIAERIFAAGATVVIAVNKVDVLSPARIAEQVAAAGELGDFRALHPVSALTGDGVDELREELVALLSEGPPYFPEDQASDQQLDEQVAELVREQALALTREEIPHAISVLVEELGEKVVRALVLVETESQKQIVIGKGGAVIKEIGVRARPRIEQLLERSIFLDLRVQVRRRWRQDERMLERLGI